MAARHYRLRLLRRGRSLALRSKLQRTQIRLALALALENIIVFSQRTICTTTNRGFSLACREIRSAITRVDVRDPRPVESNTPLPSVNPDDLKRIWGLVQ